VSAPGAVMLVVVGLIALIGSGASAVRGVSPGEARLFRAVNRSHDAAFVPIVVAMQFGTYITTPIVAVVLWSTGRRGEGVALFAAGTSSWLLAKLAKEIVRRGRPQHVLHDDVRLRGPKEGGSGFPSGHAATSTTLAVVLGTVLGGWWWALVLALMVLTWLGRMYVGVHLPLDVVGGAGIGLVVAGLTFLIAAAV
jgi:membrane-associated phospholipid phosphatase